MAWPYQGDRSTPDDGRVCFIIRVHNIIIMHTRIHAHTHTHTHTHSLTHVCVCVCVCVYITSFSYTCMSVSTPDVVRFCTGCKGLAASLPMRGVSLSVSFIRSLERIPLVWNSLFQVSVTGGGRSAQKRIEVPGRRCSRDQPPHTHTSHDHGDRDPQAHSP
jgi:hypothetical protein